MNRRHFLEASLTAAAVPFLPAQSKPEWGGPVLDIHLHPHKEAGTAFAHTEGSGATKAVLLTHLNNAAWAKADIDLHPDRFIWFAAINPAEPGSFEALRKALEGGAKGVGEMKNGIPADSPGMKRIYDLCAEMKVPVTLHFQEVPSTPGGGGFNTGYDHFDKILKAHKKTTFIGHADFFWASVSKYVPMDVSYPSGKVEPGGLTDRWLADFPNLYGDMSANSCNNALSRDPEFAAAFVSRHRNKLMFGSDCSCRDGHGTGGSPLLRRLKGKCVGRDTLGLLQGMATPEVFRKVTWENATTLLRWGV